MGNIQLPKSLGALARYCDCFQNAQRFKMQQSELSQQGEVENEKAIERMPSGILKQKNNNPNDVTPQSIETPPPIKQERFQKRQKHKHIEPMAVRKLEKQSQKISQFSDLKPQKENIFEIVRLEQDEDIKQGYTDYLNPLSKTNQEKACATAPDLSKRMATYNTQQAQSLKGNQTGSYFLNVKDKEEYLKSSKLN